MRGKIRDMRKRIELQRQQMAAEKHSELEHHLKMKEEIQSQVRKVQLLVENMFLGKNIKIEF